MEAKFDNIEGKMGSGFQVCVDIGEVYDPVADLVHFLASERKI